jgi:hypothetical protein
MKNFDPMNSDDEIDFEKQLREVELRLPPAEWKSLLLPKLPPPWFPKPFAIGLSLCWATIGGLLLTTPKSESSGPANYLPLAPPLMNSPHMEEFLLGYHQNDPSDL